MQEQAMPDIAAQAVWPIPDSVQADFGIAGAAGVKSGMPRT